MAKLAVYCVLGHLAATFYLGAKIGAEFHKSIPDAVQYATLASHLVVDGQFSLDGESPSARREPGYVAFIGAFMALGIVRPFDLTFANMWPVLVTQVLLYGAFAWGLARFTARRYGPLSGLLCLLLVQGWWTLFTYQYLLGSECIAMVTLAGAWLVFGDWERARRSWPALLGSAVLLGCACITKSIFVLAVPLLAVFMWWRGRVPLVRSGVFAAVVLLMPAAWTARNYHQFGLPIMGSIDGVSSMYRGNVLPFVQIPSPEEPEMPDAAQRAIAGMKTDVEKYHWYKAHALEIIREHPVRYALQCANRAVYMVTDFDVANTPAWRALLLFKNDQFMLMLLLAVHLPAMLRENRRDFFLEGSLLMFFAVLFLYGLIYGETRYLMPCVFVMAPFYAAAAARLIVEPLLFRLVPSLKTEPRIGGGKEPSELAPV